MRQFTSLLITLTVLFGLVPAPVFAQSTTVSEPSQAELQQMASLIQSLQNIISSLKAKIEMLTSGGIAQPAKAQVTRPELQGLPTIGTLTPASGSSAPGSEVRFTATYTDPDGWTQLYSALLLINTSISASNATYAYYNQNTNLLYMRDDANTAWLGGCIPGSATIIQNSYTSLSCAGTTVSGSGTTLTISWALTFKSPFAGTKNIYLFAQDDTSNITGWIQKGTWTINAIPVGLSAIQWRDFLKYGKVMSGPTIFPMNTIADSPTNRSIGDPSALMDSTSVRIAYTCPYPIITGGAWTHLLGLCMKKNSNASKNYSVASEYIDSFPPAHPDLAGSILLGREGYWDEELETAELVQVGTTNYLYYSGYPYADQSLLPMARYEIGLASRASSSDGPYTRLNGGNQVITRTANWYDHNGAASPTVVNVGGYYHMIYTGSCYTSPTNTCPGGAPGGTGTRLIYAKSALNNPASFTKMNIIAFTNGPTWWNQAVAESDLVYGSDGKYYLYVTGFVGDLSFIGVAQASNVAGPYTYLSFEPVLPIGFTGAFDDDGVLAPTVVFDGTSAHMWYMANNFWVANSVLNYEATIGYAKASNPLTLYLIRFMTGNDWKVAVHPSQNPGYLGENQTVLGSVVQTQTAGTYGLQTCRVDSFGSDQFVSTDPACYGYVVEYTLGYVRTTPSSPETKIVHQYYNAILQDYRALLAGETVPSGYTYVSTYYIRP